MDLCHPELLSLSTVLSLLKQIGFSDPNIQKLDRTELLNLYYKTVLPLPQREYRSNRRGKYLAKKQFSLLKQENPSQEEKFSKNISNNKLDSQPTKLQCLVNSPKLLISESPRLKPPPNVINFERKTIKLSCKNDISGNEVISPRSSSLQITDQESGRKIIKISCKRDFGGNDISSPKSNNLQTAEQESGRKIIRMINDTLQSNAKLSNNKKEFVLKNSAKIVSLKNQRNLSGGNNLSSMKVRRSEESLVAENPPKKKHRPITWP